MKSATIALCFFVTALHALAEESSKTKLVGMWWGTAIDSPAYQRDHWVIERKSDGTYRVQEFRVDHEKKLYFEFTKKPARGKWNVQGQSITHRIDGNEYVETDVIRFDGKNVRWDRNTQSGLARSQVHFTEEPVHDVVPSLGRSYRRVSEEEFDDRLAPKGEQAGARQPATPSESKSEGGDKPLPEAEGRSR